VELCHLDGRTYVSTTGEIDAAQQPAGIDLDVRAEKVSAALLRRINAASPHVALIRERASTRGEQWAGEQMTALGLVADPSYVTPKTADLKLADARAALAVVDELTGPVFAVDLLDVLADVKTALED
jgi:hypothetical protein